MKKNTKILLSMTAVASIFAYLMLGTAGLASYMINKSLSPIGLNIDISKIRLNPFTLSINANDIAVKNGKHAFLSLNSVSVDLDAFQLLKGNIYIENALAEGGKLAAQYSENGITFSGWKSPAKSTQEDNKEAPSSLVLYADNVKLSKFNIELAAKTTHKIQIADLAITKGKLTPNGLQADISLRSMLNSEELAVNSSIHQTKNALEIDVSKMTTAIKVEDYKQWLPAQYNTSSGRLNLNLSASARHTENQWKILLSPTVITGQDIYSPVLINEKNTDAKLAKLVVSTESSELDFHTEKNKLEGLLVANVSLEKLLWDVPETNDVMLELSSLTIEKVSTIFDDSLHVSIGNILLGSGQFSNKNDVPKSLTENIVELKPLVRFHRIGINNIQANSQGLSVDSIDAKLDQLTLYKTNSNPLENLVLFSMGNEKEPTENTENDVKVNDAKIEKASQEFERPQYAIKIDEVSLGGDTKLVLHDFTTKVPVNQTIDIEILTISGINSDVNNDEATLEFKGKLSKHSTLDIKGVLTPFDMAKKIQAKGEFTGIDLTKYSPYVVDAIGHQIKQGLLSGKLDFSVNKNNMSGSVDTDIKAIALSPHQGAEEKHEKTTIVPLNIAIGQLTDGKGNMEVSLPLTGKFDSPNIGISGIISLITTKALTEGAKSYLMQTFVPYSNIVSIAMLAGDTMFAIRVDDLGFTSKQIALEKKQQLFADNMARILTDKNELQLTTCPIIGKADMSGTKNTNARTSAQTAKLLDMGQQRVQAFVDYLVEQKQIEPTRLIPCATEIDNDAAIGKLSFVIK